MKFKVPSPVTSNVNEEPSLVITNNLPSLFLLTLLNVNDLSDPKVGANKLKNVPVIAYDKDGKIMDVELVPNKVNAVINIESPSKEVPLEIVPTSLDKVVFGKSIESIESSVNKVTIYDSLKILNFSVREESILNIKDDSLNPEDIVFGILLEEKFIYFKNLFDLTQSCIFELRYNGFSYKEISKLLDISLNVIDGSLYKIRKALREYLVKEEFN